jgi:hypothetical protein
MKALALVLSLILAGSSVYAADAGIEFGIRQQSGDSDNANLSAKSQMGYQFGGVGAFQISGPVYFRTGLLYTQRPLVFHDNTSGLDQKVSLNYIDIPFTAMYKFEDYAGIFAGVSLAFNLDSSCDTCTTKVQGVNSTYVPILVGATFKFAPQLGATLYFESGSGAVATGLKNYKAVGANLLISFD